MLKGSIHLTLLMGPVVPVPVPQPVIEALTEVEIRTSTDQASGFQLTFNFGNDTLLNTLLLSIGQIGPVVRTIIIATLNGTPHVLMDGVVTQHQVSPNVETGQSTLNVTGEDLTAVLNWIDFSGLPYPAMPPEARVAFILAKYAVYGLVPLIIPSVLLDVPNPVSRIPGHRGKDLEYINQLAEEAGYVFYIEPGPVPGTNIAYWGPEVKVGLPQPALNINMDAHTNIESLSFRYDGQGKTMPIVYLQIEETRLTIPVPIPDVSLLNPPLGAIPPFPAKFEQLRDTASLSLPQAILRGLSRSSQSSDVVTATGSLDVLRYGHVLRARSLVGVRGAGQAFDGLYFVKSVTHRLKRGEFKQTFTLTRNGLISTVPVVPV